MKISASLDPAVGKNLEQYLTELNLIDGISIHCDIMRRSFVNRDAITPNQFDFIMQNSSHPVDVHLMTEKKDGIEILNRDNKIFPRSVSFHAETMTDAFAKAIFQNLKQKGLKIGLAIDMETSVCCVNANLFHDLDIVIIMSVKAGRSGQIFDSKALEKARKIKELYPKLHVIMDGGINAENIASVVAAGVDTAVLGSYIYNSNDRRAAIRLCKENARNGS